MNSQHFFLTSGPRRPSPRWLEAFAQGRCLLPADLPTALLGLAPKQCIVWLSNDDLQWRQMLALVVKTMPGARVVLLSGTPEPAEGMAALDAGAMGYTHSYALPELLQEVAMVIGHGGLWAGPDLLKRLVAATSAALAKLPVPASGASATARDTAKAWLSLSAREAQVARCVAQGKSNKEVAEQLFISERTVKAHLGAVFEKLHVRDRLQLALLVAAIGASGRVMVDSAA